MERCFRGIILKALEIRSRWLLRVLTLVMWVGLAGTLQAPHAQDTPWKRRLRKGVVLNDSAGAHAPKRKVPLRADAEPRATMGFTGRSAYRATV